MIGRVRLVPRIPGNLGAEDRFAVDDRRQFVIARAEIETDAATVEMSTQGHGGFALGGDSIRWHDANVKWATIDLGHQLNVKGARASDRVTIANALAQRL